MSQLGIPAERWIWDGHPGHLIVADHCDFHLSTRVGRYLISTVGDWYPDNWPGVEPKPIGAGGRTHETFVFPINRLGRVTKWLELEALTYTDCNKAKAGHMRMCRKYANLQEPTHKAESAYPPDGQCSKCERAIRRTPNGWRHAGRYRA